MAPQHPRDRTAETPPPRPVEHEGDPGLVVPQPGRGKEREGLLLAAFLGRDTSEILSRLAEGDPLHLGRRATEAIRRGGYLIDPQRLFEELLIEVAAELSLEDSPEAVATPDAWLALRVERALGRLRSRDAEWVRSGGPRPDAPDQTDPGEFVVRAFGVDPDRAAEAAVHFGYLPERTRRRFFALLVDSWSLARTAEWFGGDARAIADDVWQALHLLGLATEAEREEMLDALLRLDMQRQGER